MNQLDKLAIKHGTDKSSLSHGYTEQYARYLPQKPKGSLLELGWGGHEDPDKGGSSARMWRDWLPGWVIQIIDNEMKNLTSDDSGIRLGYGSQADPQFIEAVSATSGPFDVIIDDASHLSSLTIQSFGLLWPHLKSGGWYVVEDTHMAYHDWYYGAEEAHPNPSWSRDPSQPEVDLKLGQRQPPVTIMAFLKRLADEANFRDSGEDWDLFPKAFWLGYDVEEVHFHHNIVFVKKR